MCVRPPWMWESLEKGQTGLTALKLGKPSLRTSRAVLTSHGTEEEPIWNLPALVLIRHQMPRAGFETLYYLSVPACGEGWGPPGTSSLGDTQPDINSSSLVGPEGGSRSWKSPKGE